MAGARRRGHANILGILRDQSASSAVLEAAVAAVDAAVVALDSEVDADVVEIYLTLAHPFDRRAVIDASVGVLRAFIPTPWRWQPVTLNHVLMLATLRG